jgi:hypothetical protein
MAKEIKPTTIIELDKIDPMTLPELASFKEKSLAVVKENPYVEIVDNPTYELAKKARTNLRSTRTELQKQEKAIKDKLNGFKKRVENVTAELIAISEPHEIKQQTEVTRYEDIKEQERLEKQRIEQERIDGIKTKIKSFADLFNSKIQSLTFAGIDDFKSEFDEFVKVQPKDVFQEFEVLYNDMLESVETFFRSKVLMLTEQEQNRLEQVRLAEERAENEHKAMLRNGIQSWFNNWSAIIDTLSFFNHKDVFNEFLNEGIANYQEFQEEYASNRKVLVSKFENKIKFLNEVEDNRIASEKLAKEKADFEEKQRKSKIEERNRNLKTLDIDLDSLLPILGAYKHSLFINALNNFPDDAYQVELKELLDFLKAKEPVVEEKDFDFDKSFEDAIVKLPIGELETMEVDFEETWDSIREDYRSHWVDYNSLFDYFKENYNVPLKKTKNE